jgi:hypothetical protein
MAGNISISTPFLRKFVHADYTVGLTPTNVVASVEPGEKRISTIIQNKHGTNTVTVILNDTGTVGFVIQPATFFSIDNYCGTIRLAASGASTTVHVAFATV